MDFASSPQLQEFRREVRRFLNVQLPIDFPGYVAATAGDHLAGASWEVFKTIAGKLGEKGWLSLYWPREYGGADWPYTDYLIFLEEIARRGSPGYNPIAVKMLAPTLMEYGTAQQRERFLKPMASGREFWCEGFTEPEAGSDLASLQTKASRDNNHFIINGQKTWSTFAQHADWCCTLVRTDPHSSRHRGLSFLLVDMSTPGVTVRPITNLAGDSSFCEMFFEDVRVAAENMVGEENEGWKVSQTLLSHERTSIEFVAMVGRMIELVAANPQSVVMPSAIARDLIGRLAIDTEIARLLNYRVAWLHDNGIAADWHAAMAKLYSTEIFKRAANIGIRLLGLYGQLDRRDRIAPMSGWIEHMYLVSLGATIAAGTSEIQRNIIAMKGLALPRA